jgi:hypothetical protein
MDPASDRRTATRGARSERVHICARCGEQMEERQCKIVCRNCGFTRDCSDP